MTRLVIIGASGFGRECLDVLEAMAAADTDIEVIGVIDDAPTSANLSRLAQRGVAYLGTRRWLDSQASGIEYVLGIGNPYVRSRLTTELDGLGLTPFTAIHPTATFGARTLVGNGSVICAGATISNNVTLGRHVHVNPNATIGHDVLLHDFVSINPGATVSGDVCIGPLSLVGASAVILQGLSIGDQATIGAGSVVTRSVSPGITVKGVPAR